MWRLQVQSWLQVSNNTGILNTCTWLWLTESEQATLVDSIKDVVRRTPKEGWRTYRLKRCGNNNKDEDNSPKTFNDKKKQTIYTYLKKPHVPYKSVWSEITPGGNKNIPAWEN